MVRQVIVCLAYYRGLMHTEMMGLQVEMCVSAPEGVLDTHMRSKHRSDNGTVSFLCPERRRTVVQTSLTSILEQSRTSWGNIQGDCCGLEVLQLL